MPAQEPGTACGRAPLLSRGHRPGTGMSKCQCVRGWEVAVPRQERCLHPGSHAAGYGHHACGMKLGTQVHLPTRRAEGIKSGRLTQKCSPVPSGSGIGPRTQWQCPNGSTCVIFLFVKILGEWQGMPFHFLPLRLCMNCSLYLLPCTCKTFLSGKGQLNATSFLVSPFPPPFHAG